MKVPALCSVICLLILSHSCLFVHSEHDGVLRRQATSSSAAPATSTSPSPGPTSSAGPGASSVVTPGHTSATSASPSDSQASLTNSRTSSSASGTVAPNGGNITSSGIVFGPSATPITNTTLNGTMMAAPVIDGLPIQPLVTPAMAVAGALMIVTGALYTLIGIKTQRLHIFFSATYLVSLAVTVLIEYVMHPPISNGIQGAYFVAASVTGFIFGALAVIFADVTEGLGCFLGGFCLSMWFLVLKPNGLLTSTAGKAIFIGCFTVGTFGLYISRYTRVYGLIGSTSFAGATVVVLGVDCFSRAGLKEFWLWIWNLNDGLFPLNYAGPYPITRGIRVEIAAIILLFVLGVMSQMKVWKIVKKRREERAAEQTRKEEERERSEEALGRRIEAGNGQERSMWDAVYGDKTKLKGSNIDSGIGTEAPSTTGKSSSSVGDAGEAYDGGIEMQNVKGSRFDRETGGQVTVHVGEDDDIPESSSLAKTSREPSMEEAHATGAKSVVSEAASTKSNNTAALDPSLTLKPKSKQPKFVPLPFTVPDDGEGHSREPSNGSSVATFAASEHVPEQPKRSSRAFSGSELIRKFSGRAHKKTATSSVSQEALVIPHVEDDRSSIAATVDGVSDHGDSEPALSASSDRSPEKATPGENMVTAPQTPMLSLSSQEPLKYAAKAQNDGYFPLKPPSPTISEPRTVLDMADEKKDKTSQPPSEVASPLARQSSLIAGNLPTGGASKVVNAYRTNEWAKYLDKADAPSVDDLKVQKVRVAESEKAALVDVRALSQTALTAEPAPNVTKTIGDKAQLPSSRSRASSAGKPINPYRAQQSPTASRANSSGSAVASNMVGSPSQTSLTSSTSSSTAPPVPKVRSSTASLVTPRTFRTSSSPLVGTPLTESPIEEGVESSFPVSHFTPSSSHLMSQRESIMRSKPSSTSLLRTSSGTSLNVVSSATNAPKGFGMTLNTLDEDDNISLSERKSILQHQQMSRTSSGSSIPYLASRTSLNPNNPYAQNARLSTASNLQLNTNPPHAARPHLPARTSSDAAISNWRSSLAQLPTAEVQQQQELELRRRELLADKNAVRHSRAMDERSKVQRESVLGREMRRGSMMDAHREAMKKMQAGVNESLRSPGT